MDALTRKGKVWKDYVPKDSESDPDSPEFLLSESDSYDNSDNKIKRINKSNKYWKRKKQDPIKLCAKLTELFLTTTYKLKVIRFKLDGYPLQPRISFITSMELLEIIFSQYK